MPFEVLLRSSWTGAEPIIRHVAGQDLRPFGLKRRIDYIPAMADLILKIGNKNYSSWSLRGWLAAKAAGLEFEEQLIRLFEDGHAETMDAETDLVVAAKFASAGHAARASCRAEPRQQWSFTS